MMRFAPIRTSKYVSNPFSGTKPCTCYYDQSYRATFHAERRWQIIRLPWNEFKPNGVKTPLDTSTIHRLGLLGWMRDFQADLALGTVAL